MKTCTKCGEAKPATDEYFGHQPNGNLRGACRVCMCAASKRYDAENPGRPSKRGNSAKAKFGYLTSTKLLEQGGRCVYCQMWLTVDTCQLDHITPTSRGGPDEPSNLQALCKQCNLDKHVKTHDEHLAWRRHVGKDGPD